MISIKKIIRRILFPQSLQKLDRLFLLYRPRLWALKLHYICYHALLVNILIAFLTLIFPIPIYDLYSFSTIGFVIIGIGAFIVIFAWVDEQYKYNIEKEYGNFLKINAFLEILGYSICIALVTSTSIIFFLLMELKVSIVIPQTELSIDLLMLETIYAPSSSLTKINFQNYLKPNTIKIIVISDYLTIDEYLVYTNNYLNSNEFKTNKSNSIFSSKYDKQDNKNTYWNINLEARRIREDWVKIVLENNLFRNSLKNSINIDNLTLLEYDTNKGYINPEIEIDKNIFTIFGFGQDTSEIISPKNQGIIYTSLGAIFKEWKQKNNKLIEKAIKNSILPISLKSVKKEKILSLINKYTNLDIYSKKIKESNFTAILSNAITNAFNLYKRFYYHNFLTPILFLNYFFVALAVLLLFLFKYTYLSDFSFAIFFLGIYPIGVGYITPFLDSFSWFSNLTLGIKLSFFIGLPTLFVFSQIINPIKIDKYSRFKTFSLVLFPFALDISAFAIVNILFSGNQSISVNMKLAIASLFHLPFIPYLKGELVKQLSLPK